VVAFQFSTCIIVIEH